MNNACLCLGSDLSIAVMDALLQPIRDLEQTTHWRMDKAGPGGSGPEHVVYMPCEEGTPGAVQQALEDLPANQVRDAR